jgi:hypothetical protein
MKVADINNLLINPIGESMKDRKEMLSMRFDPLTKNENECAK